jgi:hypothetical protein
MLKAIPICLRLDLQVVRRADSRGDHDEQFDEREGPPPRAAPYGERRLPENHDLLRTQWGLLAGKGRENDGLTES